MNGLLRARAQVALAATIAIAGCGDATGPQASARVEILLTDAPADYLSAAEVCISGVYLQGGEDEDAGRTILWEKDPDPQCFDLLELQGVTASLLDGGVEVPAGTYRQLRLVVESATATLADPHTFSDGSTQLELSVPSGAQTGIKVLMGAPILLEPQTLMVITVDAPVEENFRIQGNPASPEGIKGVSFTPVLKELVDSE